jgi:hypothetical protein
MNQDLSSLIELNSSLIYLKQVETLLSDDIRLAREEVLKTFEPSAGDLYLDKQHSNARTLFLVNTNVTSVRKRILIFASEITQPLQRVCKS